MCFHKLAAHPLRAQTLFARRFRGDWLKATRLNPKADRLLELRTACTAGLLVKLIAWVIAAMIATKKSALASKLQTLNLNSMRVSGNKSLWAVGTSCAAVMQALGFCSAHSMCFAFAPF